MHKLNTQKIARAWGLALALTCWTLEAVSAPVNGLTPAQSAAIRSAAERGDRGAMYALIFSTISQKPDRTAEIVAEAVRLVPEHRDAILSTVAAAFPTKARRLAALPTPPADRPPPDADATLSGPAPTPVPAPVPELLDETAPPADAEDAVIETADSAEDGELDAEQVPLWSGEAELGAAHNTGNTKNDSVRTGGKLVWAPGNWENELSASYNLNNDSGTTTERRFVTSARPLYNVTDRVFGWGFVRFVDDKNDGFQWTLTEAAGPGYRLLNSENLILNVAVGPGLQQTREKQDDGGNLNNEVVGVGLAGFEWTIIQNTTFSNNLRITSGAERTRIDNLTALTLKIFGDLAARLSYEVRHDTSPGEDKKETDTTGLASIVYSFETD